jgi:hypothetical protein
MTRNKLLYLIMVIALVIGVSLIVIGLMPRGSVPTSAGGMTAKAGNLNVQLAMNPAPAAFSVTTFDITITDEKGAPVSDAIVSLDLTMPAMWMPANRPVAQSLGGGKYRATGRFTMRGGWQIAVIVERGGQRQTALFQLGL